MNLKELKWPQVVLILGVVAMILGSVIVLSIQGLKEEVTGVLQFGALLLTGLGIGAVVAGQSGIKEHMNGRWSQMVQLLEKQSDQLARSAPIPPQDVASRE